jgi:PD-(D/E)XK endonuclease
MAELIVAADLVKRGFRVAFPFGEDCDWDLLFWRPPSQALERVQVKYARSDGCVVRVRTTSQSLTNGRVWAIKRYTAGMIEWLAVFDSTTDAVF